MDELRIEIWDLLYRATAAMPVREIAESLGQEDATVVEAVNHEWFTVENSLVAISGGS